MGKRKRRPPPPTVPPTAAPSGDRLRPWLLGGATALLVARPLFASESVAARGDGLPVVMLGIALATFWMLGAIGRRRFPLRLGGVGLALGLLVAWHTIAAVWAASHASPRPAINMLWEWVGLAVLFFLVRQFVVTARDARAVVAVMVALAVAISGYGLYQYFHELPHMRAAYAADPDGLLRRAGLWFPPDSPERRLFESRLASPEPLATFALTNSLAGFLAPWLVVVAGIALGGEQGATRLRTRLTALGCALPILGCLLLTQSRSACLAVAMGLPAAWLLCRDRTRRPRWRLPVGLAVAAALLAAGAIGVAALRPQWLSGASKSLGYRFQYWRSTLAMIADHPLLGCGPGNFQMAYPAYRLPAASEEVADPHNFLLEVWATAGTPAALALAAAVACFFWKSSRGTGDPATQHDKQPAPRNNAASGGSTRAGLSTSALAGAHNVPARGPGSPFAVSPKDRSWAFVLGGGACGFLLSRPMGLISAAPPGIAAVTLGLPLAAAAAALLLGWIRHGRLPAGLPAIGAAVLLVHLLAAGGIGFPGVAGSLWLLVALGLQGDRARSLPRWSAVTGLILAVGLALACYCSAYSPVLRSQAYMDLARRNPPEAERHLRKAARADPLSATARQQLAAVAFEAWRRASPDGRPSRFRRFEQWNRKALRLAPNSAPMWLASGDRYLEAFYETHRRPHLLGAIDAYRTAVRLYPNNALGRAKLAVAYRAAGRTTAFRREADRALQLDRQTPHGDQKLPPELRQRLLGESPQRARDAASAASGNAAPPRAVSP